MKTRKKTKTGSAPDDSDAIDTSLEIDPSTSDPTLNVFIPDDLDIESLQNFLPDFPLSNPTPDSIILLYRHLLAQASEVDATQRDLDDARAEVEKKEVELDQAIQDRECLTRETEDAFEKTQLELKQVQQARDLLGTSSRMTL
jgi:nucleoprotein TPR